MIRVVMLILGRDGSWMKAVNHVNPLGTKGQVAHAFSKLVRELWGMGQSFLTPTEFRVRSLSPPSFL